MTMMDYLLSPRGAIKIVQLVFVVITLGTWFGIFTYWGDFITGTIFTGFFSGMAIFSQNMLLGPARVAEILISGVMCLFFLISGIIVLVKYSSLPVAAACGAFCFFTAVSYGLDVFFAFRIEGTE